MSFLENSTKHLKKNFKLFQNIKEEGTLHNSFYKARIILIPKPVKNTARKEYHRPTYLMNIDENFSRKFLIQI